MNSISKLALEKVLEDFNNDNNYEKAIEDIDHILLFPDEHPIFRYHLNICTENYESELFLIHTEEFGTLAIERMLKENPDLSPAQCLLKNGFKLAEESRRSDHYSSHANISLVRNREGMI